MRLRWTTALAYVMVILACALSQTAAVSPKSHLLRKRVLKPEMIEARSSARLPAAFANDDLELWNRYRQTCVDNAGYPDPTCDITVSAKLCQNGHASDANVYNGLVGVTQRQATVYCDQKAYPIPCKLLYRLIQIAPAFRNRVLAILGDGTLAHAPDPTRNPLYQKPNGAVPFRKGPPALVWDLLGLYVRAAMANTAVHFHPGAAVHMIYGDIWDDRGYDGMYKDGGCHMALYFDQHMQNSRHPGVPAATVTACINTQQGNANRPITINAYGNNCWNNGPGRVQKGWMPGNGVTPGLGPLNHVVTALATSTNNVLHYTYDIHNALDYLHFLTLNPAREVTNGVKTVFPAAWGTHEDMFEVLELAYARFTLLRAAVNPGNPSADEVIEISGQNQNCALGAGGVGHISNAVNQRFHVCLDIQKGGQTYRVEGTMTDTANGYDGFCADCALWPTTPQSAAPVVVGVVPWDNVATDRAHW